MLAQGDAFFAEFVWVLLAAVLGGVVSVKLRFPPVVGLIFFGMLIGPNLLSLVHGETIGLLGELGAVLVLFMVGVEFSISKLLSVGIRAVACSLFIMLLSFVALYELATLYGFDFITSLYIGAMFSFSSTAVIIKILEQRGLIQRMETPFLLAMLIIEDIFAVFVLTFFSSLKGGGLTTTSIIWSVFLSMAVLLFSYFILSRALRSFMQIFLRYQADDTLILFSFALGIGMSMMAGWLKLSPSIGAFLAGSIIAGLPNGKDFESALKPFGLFFSSFFFLSIGMLISPAAVLATALPTLLIISAFVVTVSLATTLVVYLVSSNPRAAVFSGIVMTPIGEFSLLVGRESLGITSINLVEVAAIGVLATSIFSSLLVKRDEEVLAIARRLVPKNIVRPVKAASAYLQELIRAFEHGGYFRIVVSEELRLAISDFACVIGSLFGMLLSGEILKFNVSLAPGYSIGADVLFSIGILAFLALPFYNVAKVMKRIFDALVSVVLRTSGSISGFEIMRNVAASGFLFFAFLNVPFAVKMLRLPHIFNLASLFLAFLGFFFVWAAVRAIPLQVKRIWERNDSVFAERIIVEPEDMIIEDVVPKAGKAVRELPQHTHKRQQHAPEGKKEKQHAKLHFKQPAKGRKAQARPK